MNLTRAAIEKNRVTIAFLLVVLVMGLRAYSLRRAERATEGSGTPEDG